VAVVDALPAEVKLIPAAVDVHVVKAYPVFAVALIAMGP